MVIKHFCPTWGLESLSIEDAAKKIKAAGFDGMEIAVGANKAADATKTARAQGLEVILMAFGGGNNYTLHKTQFQSDLQQIAAAKPLFINAHTGRDYFTFDQNAELIQVAANVAAATGVPIVHEMHRGRFSYSAPATQYYLSKFADLRLTADLSHWVNVSESLLVDQPQNVARALDRTDHIHSRVGQPEAPQVTDPRAPEWKNCLDAHLVWWDTVVEKHRQKGSAMLTITAEFGPAPGYLPTLPYTNQPVASQWDINLFMKDLLKKRYG